MLHSFQREANKQHRALDFEFFIFGYAAQCVDSSFEEVFHWR